MGIFVRMGWGGGGGGVQLLCICEKLIVFYIHKGISLFSNLTFTLCSERSGGLSNDTSSFNFHRMSEIPDTLYMVSSLCQKRFCCHWNLPRREERLKENRKVEGAFIAAIAVLSIGGGGGGAI
jgi:hypothetical protein